jgi:hypothetical protein
MSEEKKEPWLNYLALTTVIFAVCATLASFKGSSFSTLSVLSQSQSSDQWAYYQAKSLKGYLYEVQKDILELETKNTQLKDQPLLEDYNKKIEDYSSRIRKYDSDKSEIQEKAKKLEEVRDEARSHSKTFGIGVIYLQIAILLSSIAALLRKKPVWLAGIIVGVIGIVYFIDGFFLFF